MTAGHGLVPVTEPRGRVLEPGQRAVVHIAGADGEVRELWSSDSVLVEAPNWLLDGSALLVNADGDLWRLPLDAPGLERVPTEAHPPLNNDHVLDPDGRYVLVSANDWHLYRVPLAGGPARSNVFTIAADGTGLEQLTFDERVNWFPHVAPTGRHAYYLAYPPGTTGHPADRDVEVKLVEGGAWDQAVTIARFTGGQGTMNVNGWDPTGIRFALVSYPR